MDSIRDIVWVLLGLGLLTPFLLLQYYTIRGFYGFAPPRYLAWHFFSFAPPRLRIVGAFTIVSLLIVVQGVGGIGFAFIVGSLARLLASAGFDVIPHWPFVLLALFGGVALPGAVIPFTLLVRRQYLRTIEEGFLKCSRCGYSPRGAISRRNTTRCSECGHVESTREIRKRAAFERRFSSRVRAGDDLRPL